MLLGIDPLLTGELLKILDEMGHSDTIVIADANFPAHRVHSRVVEMPGVDIVRMTRAVVSVLPGSDEVPRPAQQQRGSRHPEPDDPPGALRRTADDLRDGAVHARLSVR